MQESLKNTFPGQTVGFDWNISCLNGAKISGFGSAIRRVLDFHNIRGKFNGIKPDLKELGFLKIEVTDDGFHFVKGENL